MAMNASMGADARGQHAVDKSLSMLSLEKNIVMQRLGDTPTRQEGEAVVNFLKRNAEYADKLASLTMEIWEKECSNASSIELSTLMRNKNVDALNGKIDANVNLLELGFSPLVAQLTCKPLVHIMLLQHRHPSYVIATNDVYSEESKHVPVLLDAVVAVAGLRENISDATRAFKPLHWLACFYSKYGSIAARPAWEEWFARDENIFFTLDCMKRTNARIEQEFRDNLKAGRKIWEPEPGYLESAVMYVSMTINEPTRLESMTGAEYITCVKVANECIICMEETDKPPSNNIFVCKHCKSVMHAKCVKTWTKKQRQGQNKRCNATCPNCRGVLGRSACV